MPANQQQSTSMYMNPSTQQHQQQPQQHMPQQQENQLVESRDKLQAHQLQLQEQLQQVCGPSVSIAKHVTTAPTAW